MTAISGGSGRFKTKREVAIDQLGAAIRSGRYAPGQELRQVQLV